MSALERIKQEQQASETSTNLTSRLDAVEEQVRELTKSVNAVSGYLKAMDEAQTAALKRMERLISQQHEQPSKTQPDDETKNRLNEIEKTLTVVAKQLSDKRVVTLSDGSKVKASDLEAYNLMLQINEKVTTLDSTSKDLAKEVHEKSTVKLDGKVTGQWLAKKVNEHFDQAVQEPVEALRSELEGFREEMGTLGAERLSEVHRKVDAANLKLSQVCQKFEDIERRATFVGISRLALALLPLCAALILVGGLVWGFTSVVGIGPLFSWIWASFTAASVWWHKVLIALGGLGAAALFAWIVLRVSQWVYENLR